MVLLMVAESVDRADTGVAGNARLTGVTAAVLLIALAIEGFTVIDVQQMIVIHFFVGLVLIPAAGETATDVPPAAGTSQTLLAAML